MPLGKNFQKNIKELYKDNNKPGKATGWLSESRNK